MEAATETRRANYPLLSRAAMAVTLKEVGFLINAGARLYLSYIGALGGKATAGVSTPRKRKASRENGLRGGRPKKAHANQ